MDKNAYDYYRTKSLFEKTLEYRGKKEGKITEQMIARIHYDDVEYQNNEEYESISEILLQYAVYKKLELIFPCYFRLLLNAIAKFDNGYKFTVLNDEEYEDLKLIVEKLKGYLAEHSK